MRLFCFLWRWAGGKVFSIFTPGAAAAGGARLRPYSVCEFLRAWQDPGLGYVARLRPGRLAFEGEFDHLPRLGEWSDGAPVDDTPW